MESSPSAHLLAMYMRWSSVLGLMRPSSSLKSWRLTPSLKASMALSSEMCAAEFLVLDQRNMYPITIAMDPTTIAMDPTWSRPATLIAATTPTAAAEDPAEETS